MSIVRLTRACVAAVLSSVAAGPPAQAQPSLDLAAMSREAYTYQNFRTQRAVLSRTLPIGIATSAARERLLAAGMRCRESARKHGETECRDVLEEDDGGGDYGTVVWHVDIISDGALVSKVLIDVD